MRIDDITGNESRRLFHMVNRAAKRLRENGLDSSADALRERVINENVRFTFAEALEIVREYVDIEGPAPLVD
jgi:uncharacterized Fe-S cluster-containing MiaB family protein